MAAIGMAKSTNLSYHPPFRYKRPGEDLQAVFGAQTGNPRVVAVEKTKATKPSSVRKKGQNAAKAKPTNAGKSKSPKPAVSKRPGAKKATKAKKTAGKR